MLTELYIQNLATIDELTLEFYPKTTTITGETGAGKSILIEAIEIALGDRATTQLIRELSEHLLHIHGQYEHQALLKPEKQRELLDHYAGHHTLLTALQALANQWKLLTTEITHFQKQSGQDIEQSEWLLVKLKELDALQPNPDE